MRKILIYSDFDWLDAPLLVGELGYESLRGSDSYSFAFAPEWLSKHGNLFLSADLNNYPGLQYTQPNSDIFGCFGDALPDRWGRLLLNRREQLQARNEQRPARRLSSFDYLMGIDDFSRMGGFRFKDANDGGFINSDPRLRIPPLTDIKTLVAASMAIERSEAHNQLPEQQWLQQLVHPGTSLGGARPKASVIDTAGRLCIAKFPSLSDSHDVALWEHHSHLLAALSGVDVATTNVLNTGNKHHTLLSERFDRDGQGRRRHFASALTLLGLTDGCNAQTGNGYLDMVDFIIQNCCNVEYNLRQLYRRVAFNIAIGNSDDHFRNHGFALTSRGWTLAPAYDLNPSLNTHQTLLINATTNQADIGILLNSASDYLIGTEEARQIIAEVSQGVRQWKSVATRLGISKHEIETFEHIYKRIEKA